jgi:DNA mismatch repair protein MutS
LAGVPKPIITQARKKLLQLETQNDSHQLQNDLFAHPMEEFDLGEESITSEPHPVELAIRELDPDSLSPKQALEALYELKKLLH